MINFLSIFNRQKVSVVFSHEYVGMPATDLGQTFDILKYKKIRDKLVEKKLLNRKRILKPYMVSYKNMSLVHTHNYLTKIKDPLHVAQILNLINVDPWDSYILEYFRIVTGGTILAAMYALKNKTIVFNLGGGFHHARENNGRGYCLINDVAIAIEKAKKLRYAKKFLIIDLDYHQGDGNLLFFKNDENVFTFSMHASHWENIEKEANLDVLVSNNCTGEEYINTLNSNLEGLCLKFHPDLIFFIAGSDPYEKDSLCDMHLSRNDMFQRNMNVYNKVKELNIPMVVVAGGGYGPESWVIYYDFLKAALS